MKTFFVVLLCLTATAALAVKGYSLISSKQYKIDACAAAGDTAVTPLAGTYIVRVLKEDAFICYQPSASGAVTCATGGDEFPAGTVIPLSWGSTQSVNCRSAGGTANLVLTKVDG